MIYAFSSMTQILLVRFMEAVIRTCQLEKKVGAKRTFYQSRKYVMR